MTSYLVAIYNRTVDGHAQGSDNPIRVKVPTLMALQRELANLLRLANNPRGQYAGRIHSATKPCRVCCSSASYNVVRRFGTYQQDGIHMDGPSTEATELGETGVSAIVHNLLSFRAPRACVSTSGSG